MDIEKWAKALYQKNATQWIERSQDRNYRDLLVWPSVENLLQGLPCFKNGLFIDLGCGDGSETKKLMRVLGKNGFSGKIIGIDRQKKFINFANKNIPSNDKFELLFRQISISKLNLLFANKSVDLLFSMFVLQDLNNIKPILKKVSYLLKKEGLAIFILVHPSFAEALNKKGALTPVFSNNSNHEWLAEYPIIEKDRIFYVPYFHRSMATYQKLFANTFVKVKFIELVSDKKLIQKSKREKILPFCEYPNNVYYPEIIKKPSSLMVVASNK